MTKRGNRAVAGLCTPVHCILHAPFSDMHDSYVCVRRVATESGGRASPVFTEEAENVRQYFSRCNTIY